MIEVLCHIGVSSGRLRRGKFKSTEEKVAVFNLDRSAGDEQADFLFLGPCEETLPKCIGLQNQRD